MILIGLVIGILLGTIVVSMWTFRRRKRFFRTMNQILNQYISNEWIPQRDCEESRESKGISFLCRTLRMIDAKRLEAEQEKEGVTRFISDMSHQLKTPLANIRVYSELLQDETISDEERKEFITRIETQTVKMQWLMKLLFQASRLETGAINFQAEKLLIRATIEDAVASVQVQAKAKNIQIILEEFEDRLVLHNKKWTVEALTNILDNAIKYSPDGSSINVGFEALSMYGKINIKDHGIGIDACEYTRIYQRFYRSKDVVEQKGSGLGLYLTQLILSNEKGYVSVQSEKGVGSTFSVFLQLI